MADATSAGRMGSGRYPHGAAAAAPRARPMVCGAVVVLMAFACTTGGELPDGGAAVTIDQAVGLPSSGLRQRITLTPAVPASGDTVEVRSALRNVGTGVVPVTSTICGLHLRGSLSFVDPFTRCAGYSVSTELAAGDSVLDARRVVVTAGSGHWVLEVRQLLDPSAWVAVPVHVQ